MWAYLIFPKIICGANSGILLGELIILILFIKFCYKRKINWNVSFVMIILLLFSVYHYIFSNLINSINVSYGLFWFLYFVKFLLVFFIYIYVKNFNTLNSNEMLKKYIINPFIIITIVSVVIYLIYFFLNKPNAQDILWGYSLGFRLIPVFGVGIDLQKILLKPIGGGSGNLLGTYSIIILIIASNKIKSQKKIIIIFTILVALQFLSMSRGSLLTIAVYFFWFLLFKKKKYFTLIFISVAILFFCFLYKDEIFFLRRIINTVQNGELDRSSWGRIQNYIDGYYEWSKNIITILFGIGNDSIILQEKIEWSLIESFILGTLYSDGIIGIGIYVTMFIQITINRKKNMYSQILFEYVFFCTLIQWSITGGDFWGPVNLYLLVIIECIIYQFQKENLK